jgi:hypothetical protein
VSKNKPTHIVIFPSLYLRGNKGKLEQQKVGTELILSKTQGDRMEAKGFVKKVGTGKVKDMSGEGSS